MISFAVIDKLDNAREHLEELHDLSPFKNILLFPIRVSRKGGCEAPAFSFAHYRFTNFIVTGPK